jgi:methanogenic corrinoid protein MtbC1
MNISDLLDEAGIRERIVLNVGGSPITPSLADRMGCDVYAPTAVESVRLMKAEVLKKSD